MDAKEDIGVIYVASGADYLDLAIQSASSLKEKNPDIKIDLFSDQITSSVLFDRVLKIPCGESVKLACLPHSRFKRTLYLDCDTIITAHLGDLFSILDRFELAVAHDVRRTSNLIQESGVEFPPYAFPQFNAGVLLYRNSLLMLDFLKSWECQYCEIGKRRDQISFRDLLWRSDIRFYVLPPEFNLRRVTMLGAWEPLDARPTIIHSHRLLQHLQKGLPQLCNVDEIVREEWRALHNEWESAAVIVPEDSSCKEISRFHIAEMGEKQKRLRDSPYADTSKEGNVKF